MSGATGISPRDRILLTGGTGYLGKNLVHELLAEGYEVHLLTRPTSDRSGLPLENVHYVPGDLLDPDSYGAVLEEVGAVVHTAGLVSNWERDSAAFDRLNVEALDQLLTACARARVPRVVYTSSFFTLGPGEDASPRSEDEATLSMGFTDYDRTKILASAVVRRHREAGLDVVAVLPTVIYGPGPRTQGNHVAGILEDLLAGRLPGLIGDGAQVWNYVHVKDAARGHRLALERGERGRDYLLGGENRSLRDFLETAAEVAQVEAPRRKVPLAALSLLARLQVARARLTGRAPDLTPGMVDCYRHHWCFSDRRARHELGYRGRGLREGLEETVAWLRSGGVSPFQDQWGGSP